MKQSSLTAFLKTVFCWDQNSKGPLKQISAENQFQKREWVPLLYTPYTELAEPWSGSRTEFPESKRKIMVTIENSVMEKDIIHITQLRVSVDVKH